MAVAMIGPKFYGWDKNGKPLAFGKLYTYQARTNDPKDTYQSEDQIVPNTNPVILNGEGYADVYLSGSYKMVLKDKDDNEIWSSDPVSSSEPSEWVLCLTATYLSSTIFKINGNFTEQYEPGRRVRIDNNAAQYSYSTIESSVFSGGETTVTIMDPVITTGIQETCVSIIGPQSINTSNLSLETNVAEISTGVFNVGQKLTLTDRNEAKFVVVSGGSPDGFGILDAGNGNTAEIIIEGSIYNIVHFGAVDGAPDNTGPMQAAATAAGINGGVFYEPIGLWIHDQIDIESNTLMMGCGFESRDQRKSDAGNPTVTRVGYRFFNSESSPAPFPIEDNQMNVTCYQIHFVGTVEADGFEEFKHLIMCQGVTNLDIERCWFTGWQGDALVVRSGNFTAAAQNLNVSVRNTVFDGVNNDNRNAISITDVYGMTIRDNKFKNCTRSNMPGAIDIEPNTLDTFVVLNDIYIGHNNFENIGGNVAAVGMTMPIATEDFDDLPPRNMTIEHNVIDGCFTGWRFSQVQNAAVSEATVPLNVKVFNNTVTDATERPFWVFGIRGLKAAFNHYERCAKAGAIGWLAAEENCDAISLFDDTFRHVGQTDGNAIAIYSSSNIKLKELTFDNIGVSGGGFGVPIVFADGVSSNIKIEDNEIINNEGLTTGVISVSGGASVTANSGNTLKGNDFLGFDTSAFPADFTDFGESTKDEAITALPGGQGGAYQLTAALNTVTGGAAFDSVKLPTSTGDAREITVFNDTAVSIQVYPNSNDDLGAGVNAPESVAAGDYRVYKTINDTRWLKVAS